jgi:hypothetical protein
MFGHRRYRRAQAGGQPVGRVWKIGQPTSVRERLLVVGVDRPDEVALTDGAVHGYRVLGHVGAERGLPQALGEQHVSEDPAGRRRQSVDHPLGIVAGLG